MCILAIIVMEGYILCHENPKMVIIVGKTGAEAEYC